VASNVLDLGASTYIARTGLSSAAPGKITKFTAARNG
jgi:hypothetical protein